MSVTYLGTLATDLDKVRFYIGDTSGATNKGVKPDYTNFQDAELNGLITAEGTWQRATAAAFEVLASLFAQQVDITLGSRKESLSQAAGRYAGLAARWRDMYGQSGGSSRAGVRQPTRVDGYSSTIASDEV